MIYYAIAFVPRSGSNYLCDLLKASGIGNPTEYYYPYEFDDRRAFDYTANTAFDPIVDSPAEYWRNVQASQGGEVTGLKLTFQSFQVWQREIGDVGPIHWIYLRREDEAAQAVSWLLADATGRWSCFDRAGGSDPEITNQQIADRIELIREQHGWWDRLLADVDRMMTINYSEISPGIVERIGEFVGVKPERRPESHYKVQRDKKTEAILENFERWKS